VLACEMVKTYYGFKMGTIDEIIKFNRELYEMLLFKSSLSIWYVLIVVLARTKWYCCIGSQ